jgi:hypothetical protein
MERSAPRTVDGPERTSLTTVQAADWLSLPARTFKRLAQEHADWLRPLGVRSEGGGDLSDWFDLVVLRHLLRCRPPPAGHPRARVIPPPPPAAGTPPE